MGKATKAVGAVRSRIAKMVGREVTPADLHQPLLKDAERRSGYVAIYIIAPMVQRWPVAFGICSDPVATYHGYQKGWWEEHALHTVLWTPGKPAAERIKRNMMQRLAKKRKFFSRSWYDVTSEEALACLFQAAREEGVVLFDEIERQRRFAAAVRAEMEAAHGVVTMQRHPPALRQSAPPLAQNVVPLRSKGEAHAPRRP